MNTAAFPETAKVPAEFPEILRELNRAILRDKPEDIYSFSAAYFRKRITEIKNMASKAFFIVISILTTFQNQMVVFFGEAWLILCLELDYPLQNILSMMDLNPISEKKRKKSKKRFEAKEKENLVKKVKQR